MVLFRMNLLHMNPLRYAILVVLILIGFYLARNYRLFREGMTVHSCTDIKNADTCNQSNSFNAKVLYGPEHDDCKWWAVTKTCHSAVDTNELGSTLKNIRHNENTCPTIKCKNGVKMPCCTGDTCCGFGSWENVHALPPVEATQGIHTYSTTTSIPGIYDPYKKS